MTSFFDRLAARAGHGGDRREDFVGVRHKTGEGETSTPVEDKIGLAYAFLTTAKRLADAAEVHCALQTEPAGILAIKHAPEIAWAHEDADKLSNLVASWEFGKVVRSEHVCSVKANAKAARRPLFTHLTSPAPTTTLPSVQDLAHLFEIC